MMDMLMPSLAAISYEAGQTAGYVLMTFMVVFSIALIVVVLMQKSSGEDMSAIAGRNSNDSFYGKNKSTSTEGILKRLTIAFAVLLLLISIVYFIILSVSGV